MTTKAVVRPNRLGPLTWFRAGGWYYLITIASAGLFAWVPFAHAAHRLGRPRAVVAQAAVFGVGMLIMFGLSSPTSSGLSSTLGAALAIAMIVFGCLMQSSLRRKVFLGEPVVEEPGVDPAIAAVLAARTRRAEARELAARDPLMARELHIGRPDLAGAYDDGGLVDLASAPASVIARVCELDDVAAEAIVTVRDGGLGLHAVDDVFSLAQVPLDSWDRVRDRAVLIRS